MNADRTTVIKVISSYDEFKSTHAAWNRLLANSSCDRVFLTHEWFTAWWQAFGDGKSLFIVVVKHKDEIIGIAPLMICKSYFRRMPVQRITFMENEDSPGCSFIIKRGHEFVAEDIISFLVADVKGWSILSLNNMQLDDELKSAITEILDREKKPNIINKGLSSPYLKIESNWDTYYKGMSAKSRKTIRNISNRMKRWGNIRVEEYCDMGNFNDIVSITRKGWKYEAGKSFVNHKERMKFLKLLSEIAEENGWLSISCIYNDNTPIAYEYHLKYKNMDIALLAEFNKEYKKYSPGAYLDYKIVENLFNNGIYEYDMCGVQDEYKRKWTNSIRQYRNLIIFNDSLYSKLLFLLEKKIVVMIKNLRCRMRDSNINLKKGETH